MEHNQTIKQNAVNQLNGSNLFSKSITSHLYESYHMQNSSALSQAKSYDAEYRLGFPKLYSFDTSVEQKSRISQKNKDKYSFKRNEDLTILVQDNFKMQQ
jgi:hypothetical protein